MTSRRHYSKRYEKECWRCCKIHRAFSSGIQRTVTVSRIVHPQDFPHTYLTISTADLPLDYNWDNVDGKSYLAHSLKQHLTPYCRSCWAHGTLSSLLTELKLHKKGKETILKSPSNSFSIVVKIHQDCFMVDRYHTGKLENTGLNGAVE